MPDIAVAARVVSKRFGATEAVKRATLEVRNGEIVALVGENGAGKSTLIRMIGGVLSPDAGRIEVGGRPAAFQHPHDALAAGISTIPQELRLAAALSIGENVLLGDLPRRRWAGFMPVLDRHAIEHRSGALLADLGFAVDTRRPVRELAYAERQLVAVARALSRNARVLILDEPTAALESREVERLFAILASLRAKGAAIIYISHRLDEVARIADRCIVMRDGAVVAALERDSFDRATIVGHMTGRLDAQQPRDAVERCGPPVWEAPVGRRTLRLHRGEVVGIAGLLASGASILLRRMFGATQPSLPAVQNGKAASHRSPAQAVRAGIGFVPHERALSLVQGLTVRDNIVLPHLNRFRRRLGRDETAIDLAVTRLNELVDIRPRDPRRAVRELSGGNQQKVIFARWLLGRLDILLLDEPTQGVDVAAKAQIHKLIRDFAARGGGVLIASSDLLELVALADRIKGMRQGEIVGEVPREGEFDERRLQAMLAGGT
jgi:ABC-type sugar transport system ATPase subunit